MKKVVLIAALVAASAAQPGWAADKAKGSCAAPSETEAEAAIRFMTDVMVVSSVCRDTVYAEFRLRNKDAILGYQKVLIAHFHGGPAFDHWNTSLANQAAQKQAGMLAAQLCQQAAALEKQAAALDTKGFRAYAAAQAAASKQSATCAK
jgi:hypothetical protein